MPSWKVAKVVQIVLASLDEIYPLHSIGADDPRPLLAIPGVSFAMERGVATFDCSVAGLGGCPYAKGATGNVASEDVLYLLDGLGIETGVDMTRLRRAGHFISGFLKRPPVSRAARALDARNPLVA